MKPSQYAPLMHAVLDGEASPGEAADLTRLLAADPAARAEFDELQRLFDGLKGIPKAFPPEGLVHSVMSALPTGSHHRRPDFGGDRQPFSGSSVIGATGEHSTETPGTFPGTSATVHPISQRGPHFRGEKNMSEQNTSSVGNRKIWIGAGVAAAAVIVAVSTGVLPPSGKDTAGTIVPAQRYQAAQPTAADVKLGTSTSKATGQSGPGAALRRCGSQRCGVATTRRAQRRGSQRRGVATTRLANDAARNDAARNDAAAATTPPATTRPVTTPRP